MAHPGAAWPDEARQIAIDTHVHLYQTADLGRALTAGRDNLRAAVERAGHGSRQLVLMLTETARDNAFDALATGASRPPAGPLPGSNGILPRYGPVATPAARG